MKFGTQSRSSLLIINMVFEISDLDPKLYLDRFGLKIAMCMIFIKFGTQNKLNMHYEWIMNILIGIDYLDRKLEISKIWSQNWHVSIFMKFGT